MMRNALQKCVPLLVVCTIVCLLLAANKTEHQQPYSSKSEVSVFLTQPGQPESLWEKQEMIQARDSQGRIYIATVSPSAGRLATIRDAVTGKTYKIDHKRRTVVLVDMQGSGRQTPQLTPEQSRELETRRTTVNGIPCLKTDILVPSSNGNRKSGESCRSPELELDIYSDVTVLVGGVQRRVSMRLVDIDLGKEPPADLFVVPADYAFQDASNKR